MTKNVDEVEDRADRPEHGHEPAHEARYPTPRGERAPRGRRCRWGSRAGRRRRAGCSAGSATGSIGRKDRNSDAPAALNMLPKFDEVAISTYFSVLAKIRRPSIDAVREHAKVLVEQHDVGSVLGDIGRGIDRDPTSAACRATASLTPSPRKATSTPRPTCDLDDPRLLVGADSGEHGRRRDGGGQLVVVEALELGAGQHASERRSRCRRTPWRRPCRCRR